jgi:hypothetical protein
MIAFNSKKQASKIVGLFLTGISLMGASAFAQETPHEFSLEIRSGLNSLNYEVKQGEVDAKIAYGLGIGYSYRIKEDWTLNTGLVYQRFNSSAEVKNLRSSYQTRDFEDESFEFRYQTKGLNEEQVAHLLHLPITIGYQNKGKINWYAQAGFQLDLMLKAQYNTSIKQLNTSGYYEQYNAELFGPAFMGFGTFNQLQSGEQKLALKTGVSAVAEIGWRKKINAHSSYFIGLFVNYGLAHIESKSKKQLVGYQAEQPQDFKLNSILESDFAEKARLTSFGIKVGYAFNQFNWFKKASKN